MAQLSYDVFLSYARVDDENQLVTRLAQEMQHASQVHTGRALRIFLDTREIATAQIWEERIQGALESSAVMMAVLTPSFFHSTWCGLEWDHFVRLEEGRRQEISLPGSEALIFPVQFIALDDTWPTEETRRRMAEASSRQIKNLVEVWPDSPRFGGEVRQLVLDITRLIRRFGELATVGLEPDPTSLGPPALTVPSPSGPRITTYINNQERFIDRLSEATQVTIMGVTNERLSGFLAEALRRKRRRQGERAFWSLIRVVFAGEPLLSIVHDELDATFPSREEAIRRRYQRAGQGRRAVASFLQLSNHPIQWSMHEYPYLLPFVGALFEMPDGSKIVQVATLRPSYRVADYLFFEVLEMAGELAFYQKAFEDVVQRSVPQEEVVLAGRPQTTEPGFICLGSRFRRSVMLPDRGHPTDWLPSVLVCTYWEEPGSTEPLLQLRTAQNSSLEVGVVSHVSGFIYQHDTSESELSRQEFLLPEEAAENAARRAVHEELDLTSVGDRLELVDHLKFHAVDHESLYFYVFALPLPRSVSSFPPPSQIRSWTLGDLLQLRKLQALTYARELLEKPGLSARQEDLAGRILKANLVLHGLGELGEVLSEQLYRRERSSELLREVRGLQQRSALPHPAAEGGFVRGLGRLQYREFFSTLLPLYTRIGVGGAAEELARITADPVKEAALAELRTLYRDESSMLILATEV